ncbi:MAG: undecaprenyl phosphate translocase family protein [Candidatus Woesearchaeota archaeon]
MVIIKIKDEKVSNSKEELTSPTHYSKQNYSSSMCIKKKKNMQKDPFINKGTSKPLTFKDETKSIQKPLIVRAKTGEEFKKSYYYLILGFCMGVVDAIPGISGSTVSLLVKQYEFLMRTFSKVLSKYCFNKILKSCKFLIQTLSFKEGKKVFLEFKFYIPLLLGIGIIIGIIVSFVTVAKLIEMYESIMMKIFFLFTLAVTIYYISLHRTIFKENYTKAPSMVIFSISLFAILLALSFYTSNSIQSISLITFMIAGCISIIAMLLPGLSGSLVLLLLGVYVPLKDAFVSFEIFTLISFISGAMTGAIGSIKVIGYVSSNYSSELKFFILSVLIASTINLWFIAY